MSSNLEKRILDYMNFSAKSNPKTVKIIGMDGQTKKVPNDSTSKEDTEEKRNLTEDEMAEIRKRVMAKREKEEKSRNKK